MTVPPVGKSGPFRCFIRPLTSICGSSMYATTASIASRRLCGGMLVAIPTAIPDEPFTRRVREARRQDERLLARLVVVQAELDGVRVDVAEHLRGRAATGAPRCTAWRPASRCRSSRSCPAGRSAGSASRSPGRGGGPARRRSPSRRGGGSSLTPTTFAHLPVRAPGLGQVVHRVEDPAVDRLQPVAHVRQRAAHDHAHGVVEVGGAHLLLEPARLDVPARQLFDAHRLTHPGS